MTGYGEAQRREGNIAVGVELRTINSRFIKISVRCPEGYGSLEPKIEQFLRGRIRRGTIQVGVRIDRLPTPEDYRVNSEILEGYARQVEAIGKRLGLAGVSLDALLALPGVVEDRFAAADGQSDVWPLIVAALEEALGNLGRMREEEGRAMAADLAANCIMLSEELDKTARRAPLVVEQYRARLEERMRKVLAEFDVAVEPDDLLKEVSLFADRGDVSEEIVRLRSHIEQFRAALEEPDSSGRKLEFLAQELFREANTIGSKANDVEITRSVIAMKAAIERIREMIQNVE